MIQINSTTEKERYAMYMKCKKSELADMLIEMSNSIEPLVKLLNLHDVVGMCCENPGKNMMRVGEDMFKCNQCGKLHEI